MSKQVKAYGAPSATADLEPLNIQRRDVGPNDIKVDITYCGVCHSDIHTARNDWKNSVYPVVPGHEIIGRVLEVGNNVKGYKTGDLVGVGCLVDSCQTCDSCKDHLEQYCENGWTGTYNSADKHLGLQTYGGYSTSIVVDEKFILRIPTNIDEKGAAPLLCAGITTWSPLRHWGVKKGDKVGIVGLGGLGHMGVKFANAMGAHVVMITTSPSKAADAKALGAHEVLISTNETDIQKHCYNLILRKVNIRF